MVEWNPNVVCNCEHAEVRYDEHDCPYLFWKGTLRLDNECVLQLTIPQLSLNLNGIQLVYDMIEQHGEPLRLKIPTFGKLTAAVSPTSNAGEKLFWAEKIN